MGGFGSGRWNNYSKKRTVEDCWMIDLASFPLNGPDTQPTCGVLMATKFNSAGIPLPVHYTFVEEDEEALYLDLTYPVERGSPEDAKEHIKLLSTPPNYGGLRWFLSCPFTTEGERCANRVGKLYLPPGERRFGCRECHDLTYRSSQENHKYDSLYKLWAGEREGETFDMIRRVFSYQFKEARRHRAEDEEGWLEAYEDYFEEDL